MHSLNPDEWQPSRCITPCSELPNSALRPAAHGWEFEKCLWYVMEIEENKLEKIDQDIQFIHQQNVNPSRSPPHTSQTLRSSSPVIQNTSRCSQAPLELSSVLSDSTRAFSGAAESTCSYGGAFKMLRDLTYRIVKFGKSWDLCAAQRETWCHILTAVVLRVS